MSLLSALLLVVAASLLAMISGAFWLLQIIAKSSRSASVKHRPILDGITRWLSSTSHPRRRIVWDTSRSAMAAARPLYGVPISRRPAPSITQRIQLVAFNAVFQLGMLGLHAVQCFSIPLDVFTTTVKPHTLLTDWTKDLFARLLVFITMVWAPTTLRITVDEDDDDLDLRKIIQRDDKGDVIGIDLPDRMVMMSNHQVHRHAVYKSSACLTSSTFVTGLLRLVIHLVRKNSLETASSTHNFAFQVSAILRQSTIQHIHHSQGIVKMDSARRACNADVQICLHASLLGGR
jgi:hypothetical protein